MYIFNDNNKRQEIIKDTSESLGLVNYVIRKFAHLKKLPLPFDGEERGFTLSGKHTSRMLFSIVALSQYANRQEEFLFKENEETIQGCIALHESEDFKKLLRRVDVAVYNHAKEHKLHLDSIQENFFYPNELNLKASDTQTINTQWIGPVYGEDGYDGDAI